MTAKKWMIFLFVIFMGLVMARVASAADLRIPTEVAQAIANYLATKPYQEVHRLIAALTNLKPIDPAKSLPTPEKKK